MPAEAVHWMRRALALAERGRGGVEPNPLVGAVLVRDGVVVGEGWHQTYGQAHAEVNAIAQAGMAARGATLYVTLEPCCHHGKTPPCTDTVIAAGVVRVMAALQDPFPQVAGKGAAQLREAGIPIEFGVCEAEARRQNAPYLKLLSTARPYVHAKWAMTLDGKIATRTGDSKWISGEASRRMVHELRGRMDGILVGIGTALADDPLLTARPPGRRTPTRIVLDRQARLPSTSQLVRTAQQVPTMVVTCTSEEDRQAPLRQAGCEVVQVPGDAAGKPEVESLLDELGRRRWTNVLVEGGSRILGTFFERDAVDEIHLFIGPKLFGAGRDPVQGIGIDRVIDSVTWMLQSADQVAGDAYLRYVRR